jgi:predicted acetyltransferase
MAKPDIRPAKTSEWDELLKLVTAAFVSVDFEKNWGHAINRQHVNDHHVYIEGGRMVGNFGMTPMTLIVGGVKLFGYGVGAVATDPCMRGKGIMSEMLQHGQDWMTEQGALISMLGGKRSRYGRWGWEIGGQCINFGVSLEYLEENGYKQSSGRKKLESDAEIKKWLAISNRRGWGVVRSVEWAKMLLGRGFYTVYCTSGKTAFAFIVVNNRSKDNAVIEIGGDAKAAACLLRDQILSVPESKLVSVTHGPCYDSIMEMLIKVSGWGFNVNPSWQIKIVDLYKTLKALEGYLTKRAGKLAPGKATLTMTDTKQSAYISWGAKIVVSKKGPGPVVKLNDMEMARLVFGTVPIDEIFALKPAVAGLKHIFPIAWHVPQIDGV